MGQVRAVYATTSGIWWEFRYLQVGEMIGNLTLNFLFGYFWGMNGIVLATIFTVFVFSVIGMGTKTIKIVFNKESKEHFLLLFIYFLATVFAGIVTYLICGLYVGSDIATFLVRLVLCCFIPNILFICFTCLNREHKLYFKKIISLMKVRN